PPSPHSVLLEHKGKENTLLFESQAVAILSAQETDAVKKQYSKILDAYGCLGVLRLNDGESTVLYLVMITGCFSVGKLGDSEIFRITQTQFVPLYYPQNEDRIVEVRKLLNSGTFYFSWYSGPPGGSPLDLTLCAQRKNITSATDHRFFWNRMLHVHLVRFGVDCSSWLVRAMCGSVEVRTVYVGHRKALASVISRLSCERAGTRLDLINLQTGTIRTNCLDCLDRTNCVQTFLGLETLAKQLQSMQLVNKQQTISRFEEVFKQMWINNGNEISKIYAGTGAIQGGSKLMDGARSAARTIQNNLLDNSKQEAIDILLVGSTLSTELADRARTLLPYNTLHAPNYVLREICRRYTEYTEPLPVRVAVGTYNVNGGKHFRSVVFKDINLSDWLLDPHVKNQGSLVDTGYTDVHKSVPVDIYAIGFEEIVDLNAANIVNSSTENAKAWAIELQKVLSRDREYVLLTYQQLVGVCLYVFVRPEHVPYIKDVAVDSVKTGLGGHTGNKGAAAIRLIFHATSFCFVCAHFAAGQSQVSERNADYNEITRKITFPLNRSLNSHEYLFWCGDFNYRIDMDKEEIKELIKQGNLQPILQSDQLKKQQAEGKVFNNFMEGEITFPPTYKYDLFSDDYDTSEKFRAPAWTDREGKLVYYGRAELKQSDHRPVIAIVDVEVRCINEDRRQQVFYEVIEDMGPPDGTIIVHCENPPQNEEGSIFDDNIVMGLLEDFAQFGETILVRFVVDTMWITFRDGQAIQDYDLTLSLKTVNWVDQAKEEIGLCSSNTVPLYSSPTQSDYNCLGIPEVVKPPSRPPPPVLKPTPLSPRRIPPRAGVISMPVKPTCAPPNVQDFPEEGIYEEIDDVLSTPEPQGPPPPPPRPEAVLPPTPPRGPPPVPARSGPPSLPARPRP
ncbi:hypothetical protein NQ314_007893, partial [Rhamnusium bicolor]